MSRGPLPPADPRDAAREAAAFAAQAPANATPAGQATAARSEWAARREGGNLLALRLMAWVAVTLGRPVARLLLHPIALYYVLFAGAARRHSRRYLHRALGRWPTWRDGYRHVHHFAATVLDRIYFVRGQLQDFDVRHTGGEQVDAALASGRGAFLVGAHFGSFEALHAVGDHHAETPVAMVMFPDNAKMIHSVLQAVAPQFELGIIAIGRPGSSLAIRDWLDRGGLVGLLGDRFVNADGSRPQVGTGTMQLPFLGKTATFSDGPVRLALLLRRPLIFMVGIYRGGRHYEVRFETIADFSNPPRDVHEREALMQQALRDYVARLEALCREAPYNWFNFFDFWGEEPAPANDAQRPV